MDDIRDLLVGYGVVSDHISDDTRTIKIDAVDNYLAADEIKPIVSHPKFIGMGVDRNGALCLYFGL